MTIDKKMLKRIWAIEGWFTGPEGWRLANLAAKVDPARAIVEVGAFAGRSTAFLAAATTGARIVSIDAWGPDAIPGGTDAAAAEAVLERYVQTLHDLGLRGKVTTLRAMGYEIAQMWVGEVGLLFLDASHLYEDTLREMTSWQRHIPPGCYAALHDHHESNPGVIQAVDELVAEGEWERVDIIETMQVLRRLG